MSMARLLACCATLLIAVASMRSVAIAEDTAKEVCIEAHGQGQDERDQGHVSSARTLFSSCAQPTCPALVREDCARFADELDHIQPSIGFSARDASGNDLPDTSVFLDGALLTTRLDGMWHDVDPGAHVVRFDHAGRQEDVSIVVNSGEKGRAITVTFASPRASAPRRSTSTKSGTLGPALAIGASASVLAVGGILAVVGLSHVPDTCRLSKHECAAPPGDKVFDRASSAVRLSNVGWAGVGVGVVGLGASLYWYFKRSQSSDHTRTRAIVTPIAALHGGGIAISGQL